MYLNSVSLRGWIPVPPVFSNRDQESCFESNGETSDAAKRRMESRGCLV
jgi:hypothetical protein